MSASAAARGRGAAAIAFGVGIAAFAAFQQFKLPVVLPALLEHYGYDRVVAGGFMSVFAIAGLLLSARVGRTIERHGWKTPVLIGLGISAAGVVLGLLAPEHQLVMLAGRTLEGVAFTVLAIAGPVIAHAGASPRQLPLVIGLSATWIPLGQLAATCLAPLALATAGWQVLWWAGLAGSGLFAWWAVRLGPTGHGDSAVQAASADRASSGEPDAGDGKRAALVIGATLFVLWSTQFIAFATWLPQYLVEARGMTIGGALQGYLVLVMVVMVFNVAGGAALRAGVPLGALLVSGLLAQAALWWLATPTMSPLSGLVLLAVYGAGAGVVPTCLFAVPSAVGGGARNTARGFGTLMTGRNLGVLVGPLLLARIVEASGSWESVGPVFGAAALLAAVVGGVLAWEMGRCGRSTSEGRG